MSWRRLLSLTSLAVLCALPVHVSLLGSKQVEAPGRERRACVVYRLGFAAPVEKVWVGHHFHIWQSHIVVHDEHERPITRRPLERFRVARGLVLAVGVATELDCERWRRAAEAASGPVSTRK